MAEETGSRAGILNQAGRGPLGPSATSSVGLSLPLSSLSSTAIIIVLVIIVLLLALRA